MLNASSLISYCKGNIRVLQTAECCLKYLSTYIVEINNASLVSSQSFNLSRIKRQLPYTIIYFERDHFYVIANSI